MSRRAHWALVIVASITGTVGPPARAIQVAPRFVRSQLTWFDRTGKKIGVLGNMADYGNLELSPDATRVAVAVMTDLERGARDIWVVDAANGQHAPFTSDAADENWAIWSRDGRTLVFNSGRNGGLDLYQAPSTAASASAGTALLVDRDAKWPVSWSADGRYVLYVISGQRPGNHIVALPLFGDRKPLPFRQTENTENWAAFSPDGKWVAYSSTESGQAEVYIATFPPSAGPKIPVSSGGGTQARWRRDGKELYFLSSDRTIMSAAISATADALSVGAVEPLFEIRYPYGQYHAFDVSADGQRFLVNTLVTAPGTPVIAH